MRSFDPEVKGVYAMKCGFSVAIAAMARLATLNHYVER